MLLHNIGRQTHNIIFKLFHSSKRIWKLFGDRKTKPLGKNPPYLLGKLVRWREFQAPVPSIILLFFSYTMNVMSKIHQILKGRRGFMGRIIRKVPKVALLSQYGFVVSFLVSITDLGILLCCTELIQRRC